MPPTSKPACSYTAPPNAQAERSLFKQTLDALPDGVLLTDSARRWFMRTEHLQVCSKFLRDWCRLGMRSGCSTLQPRQHRILGTLRTALSQPPSGLVFSGAHRSLLSSSGSLMLLYMRQEQQIGIKMPLLLYHNGSPSFQHGTSEKLPLAVFLLGFTPFLQ
jgi:hypothetical protein